MSKAQTWSSMSERSRQQRLWSGRSPEDWDTSWERDRVFHCARTGPRADRSAVDAAFTPGDTVVMHSDQLPPESGLNLLDGVATLNCSR